MNRAPIGTMTPATEREDEAYLSFVEGVRVYQAKQLAPAVRAAYAKVDSEQIARTGRNISSLQEAQSALNPRPIVRSFKRFTRTSQEMNWSAVVETYRKQEAALVAELDAYERRRPGTVTTNPALPLPHYFSGTEFHIQPGSYHADPLAGYIYHYGTKVFYMGNNDGDERHKNFVAGIPLPKDGQVRRILDLGCSIGQSTTAWKLQVPSAEVHGIDLGAPMVRYAHKRAVDLGLDVHFTQMAAENLTYPTGSFDVVYAYILFHELPVEVGHQVVREAYRVLRPGGVFAVLDFGNNTRWTPLDAFLRDFDMSDNGEPFSMEFCKSDLAAAFRAAGFKDVEEKQFQGMPHFLRTGVK